jgi:hypothetical protein
MSRVRSADREKEGEKGEFPENSLAPIRKWSVDITNSKTACGQENESQSPDASLAVRPPAGRIGGVPRTERRLSARKVEQMGKPVPERA